MQAYDTWRIMSAIFLHFKVDSYDAIKFHFKGRSFSPNAYEKSRTKYLASKYAKRFQTEEDLRRFVFSNILYGQYKWAGDMEDAHYKRYLKLIQNFSYLFKGMIGGIVTPLDGYLSPTNGEYPLIIQEYTRGDVDIDIVVLFDIATDFLSFTNSKIDDTLLWPEMYKLFVKTRIFMEKDFSKKTIQKVMFKHFSNLQTS